MAELVKVYYGKPMVPDVSRVLACLAEKDVKFKSIIMYESEGISPEFLKIQASAPVHGPGFEDGDTKLFESRAICRYVSEKYADQGNKYLLGRDLLERVSIEQWLKSEEHNFDPPSRVLIFHLAFAPNRGLIEQNERKLAKVLDVYEQRLGDSRYLAGNEFSLADLTHLPHSHYLANSKKWGHLFNSRKNVRKWWERISNRDSWVGVVKDLIDVEELEDGERKRKAVATKPIIIFNPLLKEQSHPFSRMVSLPQDTDQEKQTSLLPGSSSGSTTADTSMPPTKPAPDLESESTREYETKLSASSPSTTDDTAKQSAQTTDTTLHPTEAAAKFESESSKEPEDKHSTSPTSATKDTRPPTTKIAQDLTALKTIPIKSELQTAAQSVKGESQSSTLKDSELARDSGGIANRKSKTERTPPKGSADSKFGTEDIVPRAPQTPQAPIIGESGSTTMLGTGDSASTPSGPTITPQTPSDPQSGKRSPSVTRPEMPPEALPSGEQSRTSTPAGSIDTPAPGASPGLPPNNEGTSQNGSAEPKSGYKDASSTPGKTSSDLNQESTDLTNRKSTAALPHATVDGTQETTQGAPFGGSESMTTPGKDGFESAPPFGLEDAPPRGQNLEPGKTISTEMESKTATQTTEGQSQTSASKDSEPARDSGDITNGESKIERTPPQGSADSKFGTEDIVTA
ncbi:hypothetical protein J5N97_023833 [Dioscorea zingiberensis]|uniref:glutathione transferase n=1 Tax=Dioscorea zingiberensis TaxID=325984 RepID=A0A9D5H865_9LILI|nr:hypothetical protein J5N97_023833 [Dioscorea zingiberensis]